MNQEAVLNKPKTLHLILNVLLMAFNLLMAIISIYYLIASHRLNIEQFIDPQTGEFPGSSIAYFFLRKEFILIPVLLIVYMVYKEFKMASFRKRVKKNLLVLAGIYGHWIFVGLVPFIFLY